MEQQGNRQSGFGIAEIMLIVLTVGVLVGGSWLVYQHNRTKLANADGGTTTTTQQTTTSTTTPATTVAYLTITEWGVKLPLSSSINDAYYAMNVASFKDPDGLPSQAFLGRKSFTSPSCNAANNNDGQRGAVGAILRVLPTQLDQVTGNLDDEYWSSSGGWNTAVLDTSGALITDPSAIDRDSTDMDVFYGLNSGTLADEYWNSTTGGSNTTWAW